MASDGKPGGLFWWDDGDPGDNLFYGKEEGKKINWVLKKLCAYLSYIFWKHLKNSIIQLII